MAYKNQKKQKAHVKALHSQSKARAHQKKINRQKDEAFMRLAKEKEAEEKSFIQRLIGR